MSQGVFGRAPVRCGVLRGGTIPPLRANPPALPRPTGPAVAIRHETGVSCLLRAHRHRRVEFPRFRGRLVSWVFPPRADATWGPKPRVLQVMTA